MAVTPPAAFVRGPLQACRMVTPLDKFNPQWRVSELVWYAVLEIYRVSGWCRTGRVVMAEIYVSMDIETDGPSPGHYSLLSFGSIAFQLDRTILGTFERNLELLPWAKQDSAVMAWWQTQ